MTESSGIDFTVQKFVSNLADGLRGALKSILNLIPNHTVFTFFFLQFIPRELVVNFNTILSPYRDISKGVS
ncbi:MAG: hypothetical protein PHT07_01290 [Paludibacter sp.]|nr:hypothetical protein [Paludibacter sp.]